MALDRREEQQESAAARTEQLASDRAGAHRTIVERVDLLVADPVGERALQLPVAPQDRAERVDVALADASLIA